MSWPRRLPSAPSGASVALAAPVGILLAVLLAAGAGTLLEGRFDHDAAPVARASGIEGAAAPGAVAGRLVTVPAVADLRIRVGDQVVLTDADGGVPLPRDEATVAVEVLDYAITPAVRQVEFAGWSDGGSSPRRDVPTGEPAPVARLDVLHRVRLEAEPAGTVVSADLASPFGIVTLREGEPTWLVAERAVTAGGTLRARPVPYELSALTLASGLVTPSDGPDFVAVPEAIWTVYPP